MTPVDELSDKALAASKVAHTTHSQSDHEAASKAHREAFQAASSSERPSLAATHLQAASAHDRHADPTSAEGKQSAAWRATAKARSSGTAKDHRAAADAHKDAAQHEDADRVANGKHMNQAYSHDNEAGRLERPGSEGRGMPLMLS